MLPTKPSQWFILHHDAFNYIKDPLHKRQLHRFDANVMRIAFREDHKHLNLFQLLTRLTIWKPIEQLSLKGRDTMVERKILGWLRKIHGRFLIPSLRFVLESNASQQFTAGGCSFNKLLARFLELRGIIVHADARRYSRASRIQQNLFAAQTRYHYADALLLSLLNLRLFCLWLPDFDWYETVDLWTAD